MKYVIRISVILLIVSLFIYSIFNGTPWGKYLYKKKAERYLSQKYQEDLTIEEVRYNFKNSTFFSSDYIATAYLDRWPEVKFRIYTSQDKLRDNFYENYWMNEEETALQAFLEPLFPKARASIGIHSNIDKNIDINHIPRFQEIRDRYKFSITIYLWIERSFDFQMKGEEYVALFEVVKYFQKNKYKPEILSINFENVYFPLRVDLESIQNLEQMKKYLESNMRYK